MDSATASMNIFQPCDIYDPVTKKTRALHVLEVLIRGPNGKQPIEIYFQVDHMMRTSKLKPSRTSAFDIIISLCEIIVYDGGDR